MYDCSGPPVLAADTTFRGVSAGNLHEFQPQLLVVLWGEELLLVVGSVLAAVQYNSWQSSVLDRIPSLLERVLLEHPTLAATLALQCVSARTLREFSHRLLIEFRQEEPRLVVGSVLAAPPCRVACSSEEGLRTPPDPDGCSDRRHGLCRGRTLKPSKLPSQGMHIVCTPHSRVKSTGPVEHRYQVARLPIEVLEEQLSDLPIRIQGLQHRRPGGYSNRQPEVRVAGSPLTISCWARVIRHSNGHTTGSPPGGQGGELRFELSARGINQVARQVRAPGIRHKSEPGSDGDGVRAPSC